MDWISCTVAVRMWATCCEWGRESSAPRFHISIFDTATTGSLGDTVESSWAVLQAIPLETSAYTITDELITAFHWDTQTFTMTNEWGERGEQAPGLLWGGDAAFLVTFDGQRLFGGRVVYQKSPRRFDYPAMMLAAETDMDENYEPFTAPLSYQFFDISPSQFFKRGKPRFLADDPAIAKAVRNHFAAQGKLQ